MEPLQRRKCSFLLTVLLHILVFRLTVWLPSIYHVSSEFLSYLDFLTTTLVKSLYFQMEIHLGLQPESSPTSLNHYNMGRLFHYTIFSGLSTVIFHKSTAEGQQNWFNYTKFRFPICAESSGRCTCLSSLTSLIRSLMAVSDTTARSSTNITHCFTVPCRHCISASKSQP